MTEVAIPKDITLEELAEAYFRVKATLVAKLHDKSLPHMCKCVEPTMEEECLR